MSTKCTETTRKGTACKAWAVPGTNPPRCASHGGAKARPGAPKGNTNAVTHGFYRAVDATTVGLENAVGATLRGRPVHEPSPLDKVIHQLQTKLDRLSRYIDTLDSDTDPATLIKLLNLHSQAGARLARFLERQQATSDEGDALMKAINIALDQVGDLLGIEI